MGFQDDLRNGIRSGACGLFSAGEFMQRWGGSVRVEAQFGPVGFDFDPRGAVTSAADYFCDRAPGPSPPSAVSSCSANDITRDYCSNNPDYCGWLGIYTFELDAETKIDTLFGTAQDFYEAGDRCANALSPTGGITRLLNGEDNGCLSGRRDQGETASAEFYFLCPSNPGYGEPQLPPEERTTDITIGENNGTLIIGGPVITGNGNVVVATSITGPNFTFSGSLVLNTGDININVGGKWPGEDYPPDVPEEGEGDEEGDEEGTGLIIGANVVSKFDGGVMPVGVSVFAQENNNPDIYYPNIGYVAFKTVVNGKERWSKDYPVKNLEQFIEWDGALDATAVAGTPRFGVSSSVTPVYRRRPNLDT